MNSPSEQETKPNQPNGFAIEFYFDAVSEGRVMQVWYALAQAGISSFLLDVGARPHISLAVLDSLTHFDEFIEQMGEWQRPFSPFHLSLSAIGTFPTERGVLYLAPTITSELVQVHESCHQWLKSQPVEPNPYYLPGAWVPHCTIAMELKPEQIGPAIAICREQESLFGPITIESIGLIQFRPVVELAEIPLTTP